MPTAPATADAGNVVALESARKGAVAIETSAFWLLPDDRPAPPQPSAMSWLFVFIVASVLAHAAVIVAIDAEPEPLPSVGIVSLSVDLVIGDVPGAKTETPAPNQTAAAAPTPDPERTEPLIHETPDAERARTMTWIERLTSFRSVPTAQSPARPEQAPQPETARPADSDERKNVVANVTAQSGIGQKDARADATYPEIVAARLARFQQYPPDAYQRGQQGSATVTFTLDGDGSVSNVTLAKKSGIASLDRESEAMVRRAAPFPPTPTGGPMSFTVPVNFSVR